MKFTLDSPSRSYSPFPQLSSVVSTFPPSFGVNTCRSCVAPGVFFSVLTKRVDNKKWVSNNEVQGWSRDEFRMSSGIGTSPPTHTQDASHQQDYEPFWVGESQPWPSLLTGCDWHPGGGIGTPRCKRQRIRNLSTGQNSDSEKQQKTNT